MRTITTYEKEEKITRDTITYKDLPIGCFFTIVPAYEDDFVNIVLIKTEISELQCPIVASVTEMRKAPWKKVGQYVYMDPGQQVIPIKSINIQYSL